MKFATIYADPAWNFVTYSDKGAGRSPEQHYQTMTVDDICALPIDAVAADDCALFMWAVDPRLPDALKVGATWGFEYKTVAFTWIKQVASRTQPSFLPVDHNFHWHIGNGYWSRSNPEMCLLFTRGKPKRLSMNVRQLLIAPVQEHSRKPDETYGRTEKLVGGDYLELFARRTRPGWTSLGNGIDGMSLEVSLVNLASHSLVSDSAELEKSL
jgi:N6-adenosine-specific RNA methylase IME4